MKPMMRFMTYALLVAVLLTGCSAGAQSLQSYIQPAAQLAAQAAAQAAAAPAVAAPASAAASVAQAPVAQATAAPSTAAPVTAASGPLAAYQSTLEQIYSQVGPSVVNIDVIIGATTTRSRGGFGGSQQSEALGSGFVWDTQGHIVTNNHVVSGATQIQVTFADGTVATAKLVGADPNSDLAVIQVNVPASELHPVQVTDSTQVKVGQLAVAIGNPFGLAGTMTTGIISGLERSLPVGLDSQTGQTSSTGGTYAIPDIIQTDAAINPGNSGGVLVDDQGRLIGVTAAIESATNSNSGVGFVIPSAIVQKVVPALISSGKYEHPYLGISGATLTPDIAQQMGLSSTQQGALVVSVTSGGPAAKAGLRGSSQVASANSSQTPTGGDVIVAIDNQTVKSFDDIGSYLFNNTKPGQTINVTVLRQGKQVTLSLTLGVMPAQP